MTIEDRKITKKRNSINFTNMKRKKYIKIKNKKDEKTVIVN